MYEVCLKNNGTDVIPVANNKLHGYNFKWISPKSLMHFPILLCFYALLKVFFWDVPHLRRYDDLYGLCYFKISPPDDLCGLREKISHTERWCFSRSGFAVYSRRCKQAHCRSEAVTICPTTTLVSSLSHCEAYAVGSPRRLSDWLSCPVARTPFGRCSSYRRKWLTWLWLLTLTLFCFLLPQRRRRLPLTFLALGFGLVWLGFMAYQPL